ncbi:hypothetical protein HJC23_008227 [Cyclotella cryptica]|uniref:Uncharacterized protein n=1 Tax=Cyclotella cryptica TaxID=29204 RepID=A0ABD3Q5Z4_9STRA
MIDVHSRPVIASLYPRIPPNQHTPHQSSSSRPLSSICLSPDGSYAVAAGKSVLHVLRLGLARNVNNVNGDVCPDRLDEIRSVRISQHFQAPAQSTTSGGPNIPRPQYPHVYDVLGASGAPVSTPTAGGGGGVNVTVTDVAWSLPQHFLVDFGFGAGIGERPSPGGGDTSSSTADSIDDLINDSEQHPGHYPSFIKRVKMTAGKGRQFLAQLPPIDDSSIVAAGGSNGVVVAWHAHSALLGDTANSPTNSAGTQSGLFHTRRARAGVEPSVSSTASIGQPEAVFLAHSRAVNRLAWHPTGNRPYLLLTASQDGTVKLWDRRASTAAIADEVSTTTAPSNVQSMRSWFGFGGTHIASNKAISTNTNLRTSNWHCVSTYAPKCEAIRDIKWNPYLEDVFAMVSDNGTLCVYDIRLNRPVMKTTSAHAGEATSVDWNPAEKYVLATGGGRDRSVKVWDVESSLNIHKQDESVPIVSNSGSYLSDYTSESQTNVSNTSSDNIVKVDEVDAGSSCRNAPNQLTTSTIGSVSPIKRNVSGLALSRHHKLYLPVHTLFISSPITSIRWRPKGASSSGLSDSIIAVATSPISGANAGGNGTVGLWTCNRPFIPLSIVEGHQEGAVTSFVFVSNTAPNTPTTSIHNRTFIEPSSVSSVSKIPPTMGLESPTQRYNKRALSGNVDKATNVENEQKQISHENTLRSMILSVGRDGQCLLQDFALGEQPILQVPKSTFALANLSPFQPGFGSLQIMAVHQLSFTRSTGTSLVFSVTDQGDEEDLTSTCRPEFVDVSPELTHLSRFSEHYETSTGKRFATKGDVCRHNASVACGLNRKALANMWTTLAIILEGSRSGILPSNPSKPPQSALSYLFLNTLQNLLLQRADAGDVQTCVVLCEVMEVILPPTEAGGVAKSALAGVGIEIMREWYFSYIDLLQQMCLFTQAASLIRNCKDPVIGALNQQSTTINEACPHCSKPLMGGTAVENQFGVSRHHMSQRVADTEATWITH